MDSNFNNENEHEFPGLDIDDSDLHLTPLCVSSSSNHVDPSRLHTKFQLRLYSVLRYCSASLVAHVLNHLPQPKLIRIIPDLAGIVQQAKLLKEKVFSCWEGQVMSTQNYMQKVVEDVDEDDDFNSGGGYVKGYSIGAAMILANVSVFTPKPSQHYLNITMRNVIEVFRKDAVIGSGSG
ncbi:hypothetical protein Tco_0845595 [Tanacetum coccineum]